MFSEFLFKMLKLFKFDIKNEGEGYTKYDEGE
jgi:hypothetical protein